MKQVNVANTLFAQCDYTERVLILILLCCRQVFLFQRFMRTLGPNSCMLDNPARMADRMADGMASASTSAFIAKQARSTAAVFEGSTAFAVYRAPRPRIHQSSLKQCVDEWRYTLAHGDENTHDHQHQDEGDNPIHLVCSGKRHKLAH